MWDLLFRNPFYHPTMLLRRSKILQAGNYSSLKTAQDYDLWFRLIKYGEMRTIEEPLLNYRKVSDSVSNKYKQDRKKIESELFNKYGSDFFGLKDKEDIIKLWNTFSKHSYKKQKISIKFYLRLVTLFCQKNHINLLHLLKAPLVIKQYLKLRVLKNFKFIYLILALIFNDIKYIKKILK